MKLSHEILLALTYVSQISDPDSIKLRFIESLNGLDEKFVFDFVDKVPTGKPEYCILPIRTLHSSFGFALMMENPKIGEDELAVFRNAFQFLGVLLENRIQARALESTNESLLQQIKIEKSLLRTVLDTMPVSVWVADENGVVIMGNAASEKIWGKTENTTTGICENQVRDIQPKDLGITQAIKSGEIVSEQEVKIECLDGTRKTILYSAAPIRNDNGHIIGAVGVNQDITERKRAEEALKESEDRFKHVFETANVGKSITLPTGKISVNQAFAKLLGYSQKEMSNKTWQELTPSDEIEPIEKILTQILNGSINSARFDKRYIHKNGYHVWADVSVAIRRDADGRPLHFITTIVDITEQKKMEGRLQQSEKMEAIGTLAGGIAHDFNNILGIILGNTELALEDVPEWNPARENLGEVKNACLRAKNVVRQILNFSRKSEIHRAPFNLVPVIKESIKFLRASIPTSIKIENSISPDVHDILGDPTQIHQVLINLCTNAAQAMEEEGGVLEIVVENKTLDLDAASQDPDLRPGRYVHLRVSDTGDGISRSHMDRIFDPYFTTKDVGKGTGLGLSVVHGIVSRHNGKISVESSTGKGTAFDILFPAVEPQKSIKTNGPNEIATGTEHILFVDDEASMVELNCKRLERLGYTVTGEMDPINALTLFKSNPKQFDLVITDMTMPRMTGDKLATEILRIAPDLPIILCTGFSHKISDEKAQKLGIQKYIEKPIETEKLAQMIRDILDGR